MHVLHFLSFFIVDLIFKNGNFKIVNLMTCLASTSAQKPHNSNSVQKNRQKLTYCKQFEFARQRKSTWKILQESGLIQNDA